MRVYRPLFLVFCVLCGIGSASPLPENPGAASETTPRSNRWNFFTEIDWIYWKASETGLTYALNQEYLSVAKNIMGYGDAANPKFDWQSGFRWTIGYTTPSDCWDIALTWTWDDPKGSGSVYSTSPNSPTVLPVFIHPNKYNDEAIFACTGAVYDGSIDVNILDLDIGRSCKAGNRFSVKPFFGMRNVWINQIHNFTYENLYTENDDLVLASYNTHMTNHFEGLGIKGGFGADFSLGAGFYFGGDLAVSMLYGLFKTSYAETVTLPNEDSATTITMGNSFHSGQVIGDMDLYIKWKRLFANGRFGIAFKAGWEQHMFFSQNQTSRFVNGENWGIFVQNNGDLYFQGWAGSVAFHF